MEKRYRFQFVCFMMLLLASPAGVAQLNSDFIQRDEPRPRIPRFRFDYTLRPLLKNTVQTLVLNDPNADYDWLYKSPGNQFSLSMLPGFRENWTVGISVYTQRLLRERDDTYNQPSDQSGYYYGFTSRLKRDVKLSGASLIVERRLYSTSMEHFRVFLRGEAGYLRYKAKANVGQRVSDTDSTTSFNSFQKARETSAALCGSVGMGVQYQYDWFGFSLIAGYQLQTAHSFLSRNQFNEWRAEFIPENYYGTPEDNQFRILTDKLPDNKVRFNQLYLQVSVHLYLGEPWK